MDREHEKQEIREKLDKCRRLASETDDLTAKNLSGLAEELEQKLLALEAQKSPKA